MVGDFAFEAAIVVLVWTTAENTLGGTTFAVAIQQAVRMGARKHAGAERNREQENPKSRRQPSAEN